MENTYYVDNVCVQLLVFNLSFLKKCFPRNITHETVKISFVKPVVSKKGYIVKEKLGRTNKLDPVLKSENNSFEDDTLENTEG